MRLLLCFAAALVLAGCSSRSFLGRRADNFTAYYNAYYNAQASFDAGVRSLETRRGAAALDRTRYVSIFPQPPQGGNQEFEKAVVKSADVLREHPDSKWADDALLLIGKAYYYTGQFVGAEQKFREIIYTLQAERGRASPLENEARFWLARTLVSNEAYDRAAPFLDETTAREGVPRRWQGQYALVQAELYVRQGQWDAAAAALRQGVESVRDRDLRARAFLLLGQVEETRGQYADAIAAYRRVRRFKPPYELEYAAELSALRVEGEHVDSRAALEKLRRMERDGKNYEFRNELRYVRGRILQAANRPDEALAVYDDVLYGNDGDVNALRGPLHYALGTLFRDAYDDYFFAAAHFDTAATALGPLPANLEKERRTPEAILDAADLKTTFGAFATAMQEISTADSLLALGALEPEAFAARILEIREQRARELEVQQRELERRRAANAFGGNTGQEGAATDARVPGTQSGASDATGAPSGFLSYRDPVRVRESKQAFVDLWGDRPLVDNWRRSAAITGAERVELEASLDPERDSGEVGERNGTAQLPQVDLTGIPRTPEAQAALRARRAEARYRLGNVLFLNMNRPDSAAAWYRSVIENDPDDRVASRAYYALAEVQQALGDSAAADALFRETLRNHPQSDFADRIRERLGMPVVAAADTIALAEDAYARARFQWTRGAYAAALDTLLTIPARYPATPVAPKALFAAGTLVLEWAARDSLDPAALPLPASRARLVGAGLLAPTDTLARAADVSADTLGALAPVAADTAAAVYAADVFRHVQQHYPGTPYAAQAALRAEALAALQPQPPGDAAAADTLAAPESLAPGVPAPAETPPNPEDAPPRRMLPTPDAAQPAPDAETTPPEAAPADTVAAEALEEPADADAQADPLQGNAPIVAPGYTLVVGSVPTLEEAEALAESFRGQGLRADVLAQRGANGRLRVGVGHFERAAHARAAMASLKGAIPADSWVLKLQ